jgi:hypothetical protein
LNFPNLRFDEVICKIEYDGCHNEVDHQFDLEQVVEIRHGFESMVAHGDLVKCADAVNLVVEHLPVAKSPVRYHQTYQWCKNHCFYDLESQLLRVLGRQSVEVSQEEFVGHVLDQASH